MCIREDSISELVGAAQAGSPDAFGTLIKRMESAMFHFALRLTGNPCLAEEATQEAYIAAFRGLGTLQNPVAFPGWLRSIVRHHCLRLRRQQACSIPFSDLGEFILPYTEDWSARDTGMAIQVALDDLPDDLQTVTTLYYFHDYSQRDVATRLGIPITTVNNRLSAARARLRRRLSFMDTTLSASENSIGVISDVRDNIVEVRLNGEAAVSLFDLIIAENGSEAKIELSVLSRPTANTARCLLLPSASPNTGGYGSARMGQPIFATGRMSRKDLSDDQLAPTVSTLNYRPSRTAGVTETGIKAIDFLCPLGTSGTIGIFGGLGVGSSVLLGELRHRFAGKFAGFTFSSLVRRTDLESARTMRYQDTETLGDYDQHGDLLFTWLPSDSACDPILSREKGTTIFDSVIYLSPLNAVRGLYPALDGLYSNSRSLKPEIVGAEHHRVWTAYTQALTKVRQLMADPLFIELMALRANRRALDRFYEYEAQHLSRLSRSDQQLVSRVRKVEKFLTQPFYVAEPYTGMTGATVRRQDTVASVNAILTGKYDAHSERDLTFIGLP